MKTETQKITESIVRELNRMDLAIPVASEDITEVRGHLGTLIEFSAFGHKWECERNKKSGRIGSVTFVS